MIFCVGSTNPVKINAVTQAVTAQWPEAAVQGFEVETGVSSQPFSDAETRSGAENRARAALAQGLKTVTLAVDQEQLLGVGLEGGVFETSAGEIWSTVWVAVVTPQGQLFVSNGARIQIEEPLATALRQGEEMGPFMQTLTGVHDIRQKQGMFGLVTNNFVNRTEEYSSIAKIAIGLWYGQGWNHQLLSAT